MNERDPLARLTEREKVCLREWLQHKSAKEIAADLGISHHAVEKRLKMARTKLGTTSSLEAARMLVEAEGYGQTVAHTPDLVLRYSRLPALPRSIVLGVTVMILVAALVLGWHMQPTVVSKAPSSEAAPVGRALLPGAIPTPGTEATLRLLVAGLANGAPEYDKISPQFGVVVRRDLPMTHPLFRAMGALESVTFLGRDVTGADVYNLRFAKGGAIMSASLDSAGRMAGGILRPLGQPGKPASGTETALRTLVAGIASGSPDYAKLSPQFAAIVRRDLSMTHPLFSSLGDLKSTTYLGRGDMGDDVYELVFTKGGMIMSASLDNQGRNAGGMFQAIAPPVR